VISIVGFFFCHFLVQYDGICSKCFDNFCEILSLLYSTNSYYAIASRSCLLSCSNMSDSSYDTLKSLLLGFSASIHIPLKGQSWGPLSCRLT